MRKKRLLPVVLILALLVAAGGLLMRFLDARWVASAAAEPLQTTTEQLDNPDRGFYLIHGIRLSDDMDPEQAVNDSFSGDTGHRLALLEINLADYADGEISSRGIENLERLFDALRGRGMRYIVRFLYDWDGHNMESEPLRRGIIQRHMQQTAPVINDNADQIYTIQGLFVGNWGEMNGTRYTGTEHWRELASTLAGATDPSITISVRMPMQWRRICGETEADGAYPGIRQRMGLFNDGMLGSSTDLGTYGQAGREDTGYDDMWARSDELAFVEDLCRSVPNGGEAVLGQEDCTLEDALDYLRTTHVSYLNEDYDRRILKSWASETISGGPWDGADGLSYVRAHLGYRYSISDASLKYDYLSNTVSVTADIINEGFAPAYFELKPVLVAYRDGEEVLKLPFSGDLSVLSGGNDSGSCTLKADMPVSGLGKGDCTLALRLESGLGPVMMANEGRTASGDVIIGRIRAK